MSKRLQSIEEQCNAENPHLSSGRNMIILSSAARFIRCMSNPQSISQAQLLVFLFDLISDFAMKQLVPYQLNTRQYEKYQIVIFRFIGCFDLH